jgi:hypothetical protein
MFFEDGNIEQAQSELKRVIEGDPPGSQSACAANLEHLSIPEQGRPGTGELPEIIAKHNNSSAIQEPTSTSQSCRRVG